jgi:phosphatidylethanolamine-binding protein (PEBP) family uncharacterized protein
VAQRTGAERLIASAASPASARAILALVGAVLLLCGCGAGSSEPKGAGPGDSSLAAGSGQGSSPPAAGKAAAQEEGQAGEGGQAQPQADPPQGPAPAGQGQKHGQRIAPPRGERERAPTPAEVAHATVADLTLQSPAIVAGNGSPGHLAPTYTCDGKGTWPALSWQGVPPGTAELALYVMSLQPVQGQIFVDWAVAGLDPGLGGIQAARLPPGAVVGRNGFGKRGYEICPQGGGEAYMFAVYALPRSLSPPKGFDPLKLRSQILALAGNVGLLPALYARG